MINGLPKIYIAPAIEIASHRGDRREILRQGRPLAATACKQRSAPIIADIETWFTHHRAHVAAKSPLGDALTYIAKYRDGLQIFLTDGRVEIDNNTIERIIRPIALNRKNAPFAEYDAETENWAIIASLITICKLNAVGPQAYLTATLTAIVTGHKQNQINELLPWNYSAKV